MRLDRLWVDGLRNLRDFTIDFDDGRLTTVVIGQNGSGKSNLIEAIATIFRDFDLGD
ncbi:MAG: AAA family ATPase, partial [Acetobacteraceae bacterium]